MPTLFMFCVCVCVFTSVTAIFCSCWVSVEKGTIFAFVVPVLVILLVILLTCMWNQAHQEGGWGARDTSPCRDPKLVLRKGAPRGFFILPFWAASLHYSFSFHFPLHCMDLMSEHLGRIISNTFSKGRLL